jgi:hypothetical protein
VKGGGSVRPAEAMDCCKKQNGKDYVEGECLYEIVGLTTRNEDVEESNCCSAIWFETNQILR